MVFSSDLFRAHNTARIVLSQTDPAVSYDIERINQSKLLREINFGVREGLSRALNKQQAREEVARRLNINVADVVDTSECNKTVNKRQAEFLSHLQQHCAELCLGTDSDDASNAKVLCVSHGGFIKEFLKTYCPTVVTPAKIGNCSVSIINIEWFESSEPVEGEAEQYQFCCTALPEHVNISVDL